MIVSQKKRQQQEIERLRCEIQSLQYQLAEKNQNVFAPYIKQYLKEHLQVRIDVGHGAVMRVGVELILDNESIASGSDWVDIN